MKFLPADLFVCENLSFSGNAGSGLIPVYDSPLLTRVALLILGCAVRGLVLTSFFIGKNRHQLTWGIQT